MNIKSISHKKSSVIENNAPKLPTAAQLELGEIAINFADGYETLSIKNSSNEIVTFTNDLYWKDKELTISSALNDLNRRVNGLLSGLNGALLDLNNKLEESDLVLSSGYAPSSSSDTALEEGDTYEEAFSKLEKTIIDNEEVTADALIDLDSRIPENIVTGSTTAYTIWCGTQTQYNNLQTYDNDTVYLIKLT